jgi:drug/metabolite transporter (DMT)-like permease
VITDLNLRPSTWVGLVSTPVLIASGQVLFKLASRDAGAFDAGGVFRLLLNPFLLAALALYGFGTLVWIHVLKTVPLTIAYSFMALTFCVVPVMAHAWLDEALTWRYGGGALLIMGGMLLINSQP